MLPRQPPTECLSLPIIPMPRCPSYPCTNCIFHAPGSQESCRKEVNCFFPLHCFPVCVPVRAPMVARKKSVRKRKRAIAAHLVPPRFHPASCAGIFAGGSFVPLPRSYDSPCADMWEREILARPAVRHGISISSTAFCTAHGISADCSDTCFHGHSGGGPCQTTPSPRPTTTYT